MKINNYLVGKQELEILIWKETWNQVVEEENQELHDVVEIKFDFIDIKKKKFTKMGKGRGRSS